MRNDISKLLGLQGAWVDSWKIQRSKIVVKIRSPRTSMRCPSCQKSTRKIHQYHVRSVKHSIWQQRLIVLLITKRRFYCLKCHKPFSEILPGIDRKRTSLNFRDILIKDMMTSSLSQVTKATGASHNQLYPILNQTIQEINWRQQGSRISLGIDEHSFKGRRLVLTVTNLTKRKLLYVGKDYSLETVREFLRKVPKHKVFEVCIDMKAGYLNTILEVLPNVPVVIDKFHVVAYANHTLDQIRSIHLKKKHVKILLLTGKEKLNQQSQLKLAELFDQFKQFPSLKEAYFIKEQIRGFYRLRDKAKATEKLTDIIMFCKTSRSSYLHDLGKTLVRWSEYILNYFNHYTTNAFTEGVHTKIKLVKRMSFGFRNINHYIAKVMLAFAPLLAFIHHTY